MFGVVPVEGHFDIGGGHFGCLFGSVQMITWVRFLVAVYQA